MSKKEFDSDGSGSLLNQWRHAWQEKILNHAHIQYELKDKIYQLLVSGKSMSAVYSTLYAMQLSNDLIVALMEPTEI